ncbi:hypothetical protein [Streptomyces sp. NPDC020917]|uniref:hypothetical protein n=1 Tax=Streptomyces sp. NPDC020917 TaxID=3365102 RepID=UPI0037A830C5
MAFDQGGPLGPERLDREVSTERDVFNCHGTMYELPAKSAGDFAKMRPIATHGLRIKDFCSYRGMTVLSGVRDDATASAVVVPDGNWPDRARQMIAAAGPTTAFRNGFPLIDDEDTSILYPGAPLDTSH